MPETNQVNNWNPGVGLALTGFLALMAAANGSLVWLSGRGHRDLVRSDYYQAGLEQDMRMARMARAQASGMHIGLSQDADGWKVQTGPDSTGANLCRLFFYRPDNAGDDRMLELVRVQSAGGGRRGIWQGPTLSLRPGKWEVRVVWENRGVPVMETTLPYSSEP